MTIQISKFGDILISRPAGKEAFLAAQAYIFPKTGIKNEKVELDFLGVKVLSPSWADEFISGIKAAYTNDIAYLNTENPSVKQTLKTLNGAA